MPRNIAAWIMASRERFTVKEAPYTSPGPNEVLIETAAVAINPLDTKLQDDDPIPTFPIKYPSIFGSDLAGTIVEVGANVTSRKVGERVIAHCVGFALNRPAASAFQKFSITSESFAVPIPDHVSFQAGTVLPLSCDSAMAGLFMQTHLGLQLPVPPSNPKEETLIVWGGSSSVGCSVIQMARAAGYDVFAVVGKRNQELCFSLGANRTFDYGDSDVVDQIVNALKGRNVVGAYDCIGDHQKTTMPCARILAQCDGKKMLVSLLAPPTMGLPAGVRAQRTDIRSMMINSPEIPTAVHSWMTEALRDGSLKPKPDPVVVGHGLEHVQTGMDTLKKGVSAAKVVVEL